MCTGLTKPGAFGFLSFSIACDLPRIVATVSAPKHCFAFDTVLKKAAMMNNHYSRPLIGCTRIMEHLRSAIAKVAGTNLTVMIRGERGPGKDVVAHAIHQQSDRAGGPFVKVNCPALPDDLIESELFGCEKGAYTGAVFRKGKFE